MWEAEKRCLGGEADGGGDDGDASLFIADGAQFRSVATARFPKRAPQLNADAAMTDVRGHGGPMDAKKAQEIKNRRARGEKVDATTKELTWFQRNYMWVVPVTYLCYFPLEDDQMGKGQLRKSARRARQLYDREHEQKTCLWRRDAKYGARTRRRRRRRRSLLRGAHEIELKGFEY